MADSIQAVDILAVGSEQDRGIIHWGIDCKDFDYTDSYRTL